MAHGPGSRPTNGTIEMSCYYRGVVVPRCFCGRTFTFADPFSAGFICPLGHELLLAELRARLKSVPNRFDAEGRQRDGVVEEVLAEAIRAEEMRATRGGV